MIPSTSKVLCLSCVSALAIAVADRAVAACNPTGTNQTCTNNGTIDGGANRAISDTANLNLTNLYPGLIKSTSAFSTVWAGGNLVLDNAGSITNVTNLAAAAAALGNATVINRVTGVIEGKGSSGGNGLSVGGMASGTLTLDNYGLIDADVGVHMFDGTIKNYAGATIAGADAAIYAGGSGTAILNSGNIFSNATGGRAIVLDNGGSVTTFAGSLTQVNDGTAILGGSASAVVTITNAGQIASVNGGDAVGLNGVGSVVNNQAGGTIYGYRYGIAMADGTIINDGTITGKNGAAIYSPDSSSYLTIENHGKIQSIGTGVYGVQSGDMDVLNLATGEISSSNDTLKATGILHLANYGTITSTAGYGASAGVLDIQNASSGFIDGGLFETGASRIVNAGRIVAPGAAVAMTGTGAALSNLAGGTIRGTIGVHVQGNGKTISNSGMIEGSNPYSAIVYKAGVTGEVLNVNPGASFVGGMNWNRTINNTIHFGRGSYTVGVMSYLLDQNSITINKPSQVLTANLDANGTGTLVVTDTGGAAALSAVPGAAVTGVFSAVDDVMDRDVERPGKWTPPNVRAATAPLAYADEPTPRPQKAAAVLLDDSTALDADGNLVWMRAGGTLTNRSATDGQVDRWTHVGTLTVGVDRMIEDWRLGVMGGGGLAASSVDGGSSKVQSDLWYGGLYARHSFGAMTFDAALLAGGLSARSERQIFGLAGAETATGDSRGWFGASELGLSTRYALNAEWFLTPKATVRYVHAGFGAYAEEGSSQNAAYDAHGLNRLEERLEIKLTHQTQDAGGLATRLSIAGAIFDAQTIGRTAFTGDLLDSQITITPDQRRSDLGAAVSLGAETQLSRSASLYGTVSGTLESEHSRTLAVKGGFKLAF